MSPELKAKLEACQALPSPPSVASRIVAIANDPDAGIQDVAKVMACDPALSAKVLRLANSPLYARRGKVASIRDAAVMLGLNATMALALSFSLLRSWQTDTQHNGLDYPLFWRRALLNATVGRALAERTDLRKGEEMFLACLLQDIGMLALARLFPGLYAGIDNQVEHEQIIRAERTKLDVDHAAVGGWLLKSWSFPDLIEQSVASSHDPSRVARVHPNAAFVRCAHVAGRVTEQFLVPSGGRLMAALVPTTQRILGIDRQQLAEVVQTVTRAIPEIECIFEMPILAAAEADAILEEAREALMLLNLQSQQTVDELKNRAESLEARTRELEEASRRDELTGAYNRRYLDAFLATAFQHAKQTQVPLSIAFADLDDFKRVNDQHGHQAGDRVLIATARLLQAKLRSSDVVARYGGEEFVLVFPETDGDTALMICERVVRECARARHALTAAASAAVTISMGTATLCEGSQFGSFTDLVAAADKALYAAKVGGRNRAVPFRREPDAGSAAVA